MGFCKDFYSEMKTFNELFGPSIYLLTLDLFLQHPDELMNLREIARRIDRNPGSVSRVLPRLVEKEYVTPTRIGVKIVAYKLNKANTIVNLLLEFHERLGEFVTK
jgi:DNA-binding IclR family transcriptional regulator